MRARHFFRDSTLTDDPSKYSVYEVELIERWAQGSVLILGDAGTVGCLSAQVRQVQCPYRSGSGQGKFR